MRLSQHAHGLLLAALLTALAPVPGAAQASDPAGSRPVPETVGPDGGVPTVMEMLYQRTIFRVDIFTLRVELGPEEGARLRSVARGSRWGEEVEEEMAGIVMDAQEVLVSTRFLRNVDLGRFLEGLQENLRNARAAGYISPDAETRILADTEAQYGILSERGFRKGDTIRYRISGDSLRLALRDRDGLSLGESTGFGAERRQALLGSYMAPGSDFRRPLLRSLVPGDN